MQEKDFFSKTTKQGRFHRNILKFSILLAGVLIAGWCYLQTQGKQEYPFDIENASSQSDLFFIDGEQNLNLPETNQTEHPEPESTEEKTKALLYVHVCGQVKEPGVYQLEEGARIYDAVQLAGGFTEEAVEEAINLAKVITDGEQIRIPDHTEAEQFLEALEAEQVLLEARQTESSLINLNTATKEQLMTLTGIGEAKAKDIIAYREEYGGFQNIEEIMKVPGIKEAAFAKIKNDIVVK